MRQVSQKAYTPQLISIGPLHYRKRNLASISKYKVNYQEKFLQKTSKKTLESFRSFIELKEKVILNSYEALIYEDEFVMMIFYDALFIMELFLRKYKKEMKNDSKITDFLLKEMWSTISTLKVMYSATSLHDIGVELTVESDPTTCLLDIKFHEHEKLKITKLAVHCNTKAYFQNVKAFEMCHYPDYEAYVCAYIEQLNHHIQTAQAVEFKNEGKLVSIINTNITVKGMIKKLMQGIGEPPACYWATSNQLNHFYKEAWELKVAIFMKQKYGIMKRVYFPNLWKGTKTVAALTMVVLTFIQTVLAFLK
ncbi:hypothetical protein V6Z11_D13G193600 [Gossypium hirsutum]